MIKTNTKKQYKVKNWSKYNEALKKRGSLEMWIDPKVLQKWYAKPSGKRGAQAIYSDKAIILTLQFGKVFHQRLRQTEGLVCSLFKILKINLPVPDYSTLSRRAGKVTVRLPKKDSNGMIFIVDSTGLKVYGEGEWKVRKHGYSKHRTWMKFHVGIDSSGEIRAVELTDNSVTDGQAASSLFEQEQGTIDQFIGDGAYDKRSVYNICKKRKVKAVHIPPQKNARIWKHGNCTGPPHPRDKNLRKIRKTSRKRWKQSCGYHKRSLSETAMYRLKTVLGDRLYARSFMQQRTEVLISATILNKMITFGMPDSYAAI